MSKVDLTEAEIPPKTKRKKLKEWIFRHPFEFLGLVVFILTGLLIIYWAIWADISPEWTGFGTYDERKNGVRAKTLWDWMDLLLVPIILAAGGIWFNRSQKQTEREIALEKQWQLTLENYLERMKELLLGKNLSSEAEPAVKVMAQTWTLNAMRELNSSRNAQVIQFLKDLKMIGEYSVIDLTKANLKNADLNGVDFKDVYLGGAELQGASLEEASLIFADFECANFSHANLSKAFLVGTNLKLAIMKDVDLTESFIDDVTWTSTNLTNANLEGVDLSSEDLRWSILNKSNLKNANLKSTNLMGASLIKAKLNRADLRGADLREADLHGAVLELAKFEGCYYSTQTKWPNDFYPHSAGAILLDRDSELPAAH